MAENEAANRQKCRSKTVDVIEQTSRRAQWFSFIIAMTVIIGALILIGMGRTIGGGIAVIISSLAALVIAFFGGQYLESQREATAAPDEPENNSDGERGSTQS